MENRFGIKDFFLLLLLCILIVSVWLSMQQVDRQWSLLQTMQKQGESQTRELAAIHRALLDGAVAAPTAAGTSAQSVGPAAPAQVDGFKAIKEAEAQPDFARGDWLIDNFGAKLPRITPLISTDLYADWVQSKVLESLIYQDPDTLEYLPQLARSWQVSKDGLTFTFQLRKGVTFSDGEPFTADDVVFSYNLVMNPKIAAARQRAYYDKVKSVEKKGDDEVVFTMKEPYFESLDLCGGISVLPKHFYSKYSEEEINTNPGLLMGTGAYKMRDPAAWRPGQKMELLRNDTYWGEPGTFNRYIFLEVQEEAAEETMFGNGELDVFATQPEQYLRLMRDPKVSKHADHYAFNSPMNGYYYIAWNQKRSGSATRFADARVRKAMTMLVDRERIAKDIFLGFATPISGPFTSGSPQEDPSVKPLPYDPEGARRLLADAGYKDPDTSGVLKGPDGAPFIVKLSYASGNATIERVVLLIKDGFAKAGITLAADPVDWPILVKKLDTRDFDAVSLGWGGSVESDLYQEFDSSQIQDGGDNFMSYANPALDKFVEEARRTVDTSKRMELWHQAHRVLADDQPYTFLVSRQSLRFMDARIKNVRLSKIGLNYIYRSTMPMPWYVPKTMQKYRQ